MSGLYSRYGRQKRSLFSSNITRALEYPCLDGLYTYLIAVWETQRRLGVVYARHSEHCFCSLPDRMRFVIIRSHLLLVHRIGASSEWMFSLSFFLVFRNLVHRRRHL